MSRYKVVCLDMFQTLVDVNSRRHEVWKKILGDSYSKDFAEECWNDANKLVYGYFNKYVSEESNFYNTKYIFEKCYQELFPLKGISFNPKTGAEILAKEHGFSSLYNDVEMFIKSVSLHYPICLVSDTDRDMILPLLERFNFDKVFISEDLQCYKLHPSSRIFVEVLNYYKVEPKEIIHIGDGYSDVIGANRVGITTCWLNRYGAKWNNEITPEYIATSLIEIAAILKIEMR